MNNMNILYIICFFKYFLLIIMIICLFFIDYKNYTLNKESNSTKNLLSYLINNFQKNVKDIDQIVKYSKQEISNKTVYNFYPKEFDDYNIDRLVVNQLNEFSNNKHTTNNEFKADYAIINRHILKSFIKKNDTSAQIIYFFNGKLFIHNSKQQIKGFECNKKLKCVELKNLLDRGHLIENVI